jgi:hypothetical protein
MQNGETAPYLFGKDFGLYGELGGEPHVEIAGRTIDRGSPFIKFGDHVGYLCDNVKADIHLFVAEGWMGSNTYPILDWGQAEWYVGNDAKAPYVDAFVSTSRGVRVRYSCRFLGVSNN